MTLAERMAAAKREGKPFRPPDPHKKRPLRCKLKGLRKSLGLSLSDVASGVATSGQIIQRAERGHGLNLKLALRIAGFFGLAVEDIWGNGRKS